MKKVLLFCAVIFAFAACAPKESKDASTTEDSVVVVDTVVVDSMVVDTTAAPMK